LHAPSLARRSSHVGFGSFVSIKVRADPPSPARVREHTR
jgi:hypothetical protein